MRAKAFAAFDNREKDKGEEFWATALKRTSEVESHFRQSSQDLETALMLDASRRDVRSLFAELLYERALVADLDVPLGR